MIDKTPIGVPFFDASYGGVYRNRVVLATGRSGSGKTMLGLQFVAQGLRLQERCLMLSARRAHDLAIAADALGIPVAQAIESGALTFLEYNEFVPGRDQESSIMLPPDGFVQLKEIIEAHAVQRVVIDSVLPWIALPNPTHLAEHVFSLVRAFERLGVTTVFTLPKPVSAAAVRLRKLLEDIIPISVTLVVDASLSRREWVVSKYLGMSPGAESIRYDIDGINGFVAQSAGIEELRRAPARTPVASTIAAGLEKTKTSFASLVLDQSSGEKRRFGAPASASGRGF